jgi:hypothetical protein
MKALCLTIAIVFCYVAGFAQTEQAPTLTLGLNELVNFKKGVIDVELLSSIISAKQEEIKKEIIKREILAPIHDKGNFMYYNYALNVTNLLLKEKNKKVISREVLEYTSNFALVYGFTELYLQLAIRTDDINLRNFITQATGDTVLFNNLIDEFKKGENSNIFALSRLRNTPLKYSIQKEEKCKGKNYKLQCALVTLNDVLLDMVFDICRNNYAIQKSGFFVQALNVTEDEYKERNMYQKWVLSLKKVANNDTAQGAINDIRCKMSKTLTTFFEHYDDLKETNFLQGNDLDAIDSIYKNHVTELINKTKEEIDMHENQIKLKNDTITNLKENFKKAWTVCSIPSSVNKVLETDLGSLDTGIIKRNCSEIIRQKNKIKSVLGKTSNEFKSLPDGINLNLDSLNNFISELKGIKENNTITWVLSLIELKRQKILLDEKNDIIKDIEKTIVNLKNSQKILKKEKQIMGNTSLFFESNKTNIHDYLLNKQNQSFTKEEKFVIQKVYKALQHLENPNQSFNNLAFANYLIDSLNVELVSLVPNNKELVTVITSFEFISIHIKRKLLGEFKPKFNDIKNITTVNPKKFIEFITRLNELNKAETYDYLFKVLIDAGNVFADDKTVKSFNSVVNTVKEYTLIDKEQETLSIDVESIISVWYDKYADINNARITMYFGIGLNQGIFINSLKDTVGVGFASEKIGIRYKFWDIKSRRAKRQDYDTRKPIVSNVYTFAYGSGLLYNLTNLKTNENFNNPLLGIGFGACFYNYLDFNVSFAAPIANNKKFINNSIINIGFDIKITEYLTALNKKRLYNKAVKDADKKFSQAN